MSNSVKTSVLLILLGCASHEHVRPGPEGVHSVVIRGPEKNNTELVAISEAKSFCDENDKHPAILSEKTRYTGHMDENTYNAIKGISKASQIGGVLLENGGGKKEKNIGKGMSGMGEAISGLDEEAYTTSLSFKCI